MTRRTISVSAATIGIAVLAACGGRMETSPPPLPATDAVRNIYPGVKDLYVTDLGTNAVELLKNRTYAPDTTITSGVNHPNGGWIDKKGNLYVANSGADNITEYAPNDTTPAFTYSAGMEYPAAVTTDAAGNVYEGDYDNGVNGHVSEYPQHSDAPKYTCQFYPPGGIEGVAVDGAHDVFLAYNLFSSGGAEIVEFKGGLRGCHGTALGVRLEEAGGIAIDNNANLVVCDIGAQAVDVIDPPYSGVTRTIGSGFTNPFGVSLGKSNKLAFVADPNKRAVYVIDFATGKIRKTLGFSDGVYNPSDAIDGPNAVY